MDHQGLRVSNVFAPSVGPKRRHGLFQRVPYDEADMFDTKWFVPNKGTPKVHLQSMKDELAAGRLDLWRICEPAEGIAVTYPRGGRLFIHYLHGRRLFANLNREDLLYAAEAEGLKGMAAETLFPAVLRILLNLGFEIASFADDRWYLELDDG